MQSGSRAPLVICHVEAGACVGMGHLARSGALMGSLRSAGMMSILDLDADDRGRAEAKARGFCVNTELPQPPAALILDAVHVPGSFAAKAWEYFPRILVSPICDRADLASHVLVRSAPDELRAAMSPQASLVVDPDFAFVTAERFRPVERSYESLRVGLCLSGGDDPFDIDRIVAAISHAPPVAEIRVIDRRLPAVRPRVGQQLRRVMPGRAPWDFFAGINFFVGGDGIMLAEAIAQAIPALSLTSSERLEKNRALLESGALRALSRTPFNAAELTRLLSDRVLLEKMHDAAMILDGPSRGETLARHVREILRKAKP